MTASYALMDTETDNLVGSFPSQTAALHAVAATAKRFGEDAREVRSLVLYREDGPADEGYVAEGDDLVRLALTTAPATSAAKGTAVRVVRSVGFTGSHRPVRRAPLAARSVERRATAKNTAERTAQAIKSTRTKAGQFTAGTVVKSSPLPASEKRPKR